MLTIFGWNFEIWAVQKYVNLVDLEKCCKMSNWTQKSASIQPRTSLPKCPFSQQSGNGSAARSSPANSLPGSALRCKIRSYLRPIFSVNFYRFSPTCKGSFSSVSKPIFATKYSFCSIFRDLEHWHSFAPLKTENISKKMPNVFELFVKFLTKFRNFWIRSGGFSRVCPLPKKRVQKNANLVNLEKCCKMANASFLAKFGFR